MYLVAGGDLVALFDNRDAADIMLVTMVGANLDPVTACLSAARWVEVRAGLLADAPGVTITDTRTGRAGSTVTRRPAPPPQTTPTYRHGWPRGPATRGAACRSHRSTCTPTRTAGYTWS